MQQQTNIGIIGTGFIAKGLVRALEHHPELQAVAALTRRDIAHCPDFPRQDILTQSIDELIEKSDLIVECSGDVVYATDSINQVMQADLPAVTMNSEFHVTTGSWFVNKGYITEAEGDQPGSTAALHKEAISKGSGHLSTATQSVFKSLSDTGRYAQLGRQKRQAAPLLTM